MHTIKIISLAKFTESYIQNAVEYFLYVLYKYATNVSTR